MTWTFTFDALASWQPAVGAPSGVASGQVSLFETLALAKVTSSGEYTLLSDSPQAVSFGSVTNAHVVILSSNAHVVLTITSADGTSQTFPLDGVLYLSSKSVPITAITLTRNAGVDTTVEVSLGQLA